MIFTHFGEPGKGRVSAFGMDSDKASGTRMQVGNAAGGQTVSAEVQTSRYLSFVRYPCTAPPGLPKPVPVMMHSVVPE